MKEKNNEEPLILSNGGSVWRLSRENILMYEIDLVHRFRISEVMVGGLGALGDRDQEYPVACRLLLQHSKKSTPIIERRLFTPEAIYGNTDEMDIL